MEIESVVKLVELHTTTATRVTSVKIKAVCFELWSGAISQENQTSQSCMAAEMRPSSRIEFIKMYKNLYLLINVETWQRSGTEGARVVMYES